MAGFTYTKEEELFELDEQGNPIIRNWNVTISQNCVQTVSKKAKSIADAGRLAEKDYHAGRFEVTWVDWDGHEDEDEDGEDDPFWIETAFQIDRIAESEAEDKEGKE